MSLIEHFRTEDRACVFLENAVWNDRAVCPSCGEHQRIGRLNGFTTTTGTWKCYACRKPFSARRNTVFEGSHMPVHVWLQGLYILAGTDFHIGAKRLATVLGLSLRSAFLLKQRIQKLTSGPPVPECSEHMQCKGADSGYLAPVAPSGTSALRFQRFIVAISDFDVQKTEAVFERILPHLLTVRPLTDSIATNRLAEHLAASSRLPDDVTISASPPA